jgi:hypothetical protein
MICRYCDEPITPPDRPVWGLGQHYACAVRQVVGSVAHQQRRCACYGGTAADEEADLTKRQAAEAALAYWRTHGFWKETP